MKAILELSVSSCFRNWPGTHSQASVFSCQTSTISQNTNFRQGHSETMMDRQKNKTTLCCIFLNDSISLASSFHLLDKNYLDAQPENHPCFLTAFKPEKSATSLSPPYIRLMQSQLLNLPPEMSRTSPQCALFLTATSQ